MNDPFRRLFVLADTEVGTTPFNEYASYLGQDDANGPHASGYLTAAQIVKEDLEQADRANTLIYPLLFLLRHAATPQRGYREAIPESLGMAMANA